MKEACIILTLITVSAIIFICIMVKFATDISVEEKQRVSDMPHLYKYAKTMEIINIHNINPYLRINRYPYLAAVTRDAGRSWSFTCFACVILKSWIVTAAHCWKPDHTDRILLYHNFRNNHSSTNSIYYWKIHEDFLYTDIMSRNDIALAKVNEEISAVAYVDSKRVDTVNATVWKTVSTMDRKIYLTNDLDEYRFSIAPPILCELNYKMQMDESLICVDMSGYDDCFIQEFGPIFSGNQLVGVLTRKPKDCDTKVAIFTNISYYANWIRTSTRLYY